MERQRINHLRAQMQQEGIPVNHMTTKLDKTLSQKRCRLSLQLFLTVRLQGFINFSGLHAPIFCTSVIQHDLHQHQQLKLNDVIVYIAGSYFYSHHQPLQRQAVKRYNSNLYLGYFQIQTLWIAISLLAHTTLIWIAI